MNWDTITALSALSVSIVATGLAVWSAWEQRRHMRLSLRPVVTIRHDDYEELIDIHLENKGLGPARITSLRVTDQSGRTTPVLYHHLPELPRGVFWQSVCEEVDGDVVAPGRTRELLVLESQPKAKGYKAFRNEVRRALSTLTVDVEYEDLYGTTMEPAQEQLRWFGRHPNED